MNAPRMRGAGCALAIAVWFARGPTGARPQTMQRVGSFLMVLAAAAARFHVADEDTMPFGSTRR